MEVSGICSRPTVFTQLSAVTVATSAWTFHFLLLRFLQNLNVRVDS